MTLPLWLIPALPLAGFLLNGLVALVCGWRRAAKATAAWREAHPDDARARRRVTRPTHGHDEATPTATTGTTTLTGTMPGRSSPTGNGSSTASSASLSVGLAAVVAFANLVPYVAGSLATEGGLAPVVQTAYRWMAAGHVTVDLAFRLDALSAMMLSFVTFVGTPHPRLQRRLHAGRGGVRPLLRLPEPLHVRDADARPRQQPAGPLHRLGGRRALLLPPHRLLLRQGLRRRRRQEGVRHEPGRRLRDGPRDLRDPRPLRDDRLLLRRHGEGRGR